MFFNGAAISFLGLFALADLVPMDVGGSSRGLREARNTAYKARLLQYIGMALAFLGILVTGSATKWSANEGYVPLIVVTMFYEILSLRIILTMRKRISVANRYVLPV